MSSQNVYVGEVDSFVENQKKAVSIMQEKRLNALAIPQGSGFYIVKPDTPEANERQEKNLVFYKTNINGQNFLICRA